MNMKRGKLLLAAVGLMGTAWVLAGTVSAQPAQSDQPAGSMAPAVAAPAKKGGDCKADKEKFCKDVKGKDEVHKCLKEHEAELSDSCKQHRQTMEKKGGKMKEHMEKMMEACKADTEKLCADAKGKDEVRKCMKAHEADLSDACKAAREKMGSKKGMKKEKMEKKETKAEPAPQEQK